MRVRGTTMCTPLVGRIRGGPGSSMALTTSTHGPAALTTARARTVTSRPPTLSVSWTPTTRPDSFTNPITRAYETATAPASRAESRVSSTRRASSVQQSQYTPAPRRPSVRSAGSFRATAAAPSIRCRWTLRMPARKSYAQSPAASFHLLTGPSA